jgi:hypothetical protein
MIGKEEGGRKEETPADRIGFVPVALKVLTDPGDCFSAGVGVPDGSRVADEASVKR